ncbi:MAG: hypothetical protein SGJ07_15320 [Rhodospirillaceae bacterium]|nr:hypothetical protein [Rhodospirillaceae bacterium]
MLEFGSWNFRNARPAHLKPDAVDPGHAQQEKATEAWLVGDHHWLKPLRDRCATKHRALRMLVRRAENDLGWPWNRPFMKFTAASGQIQKPSVQSA